MVALIAENELKQHSDVYSKVMQDLLELKKYSPEKDHNFAESATWADDNKAIGWGIFDSWHFVDTPVIEAGWHGETDLDPSNVTWVLDQLTKTLKDTRFHKFDDKLS